METAAVTVWDDEDGNCYAEGHHESEPFLDAVAAYVEECGLTDELVKIGLSYRAENVDHVWGTPNIAGADDEWSLCDEDDPDAVPFTRVRP